MPLTRQMMERLSRQAHRHVMLRMFAPFLAANLLLILISGRWTFGINLHDSWIGIQAGWAVLDGKPSGMQPAHLFFAANEHPGWKWDWDFLDWISGIPGSQRMRLPLWLGIVMVVLLVLLLEWISRQVFRRCLRCGYSPRWSQVDVCPECGFRNNEEINAVNHL